MTGRENTFTIFMELRIFVWAKAHTKLAANVSVCKSHVIERILGILTGTTLKSGDEKIGY